jgi:hypothetical protein
VAVDVDPTNREDRKAIARRYDDPTTLRVAGDLWDISHFVNRWLLIQLVLELRIGLDKMVGFPFRSAVTISV